MRSWYLARQCCGRRLDYMHANSVKRGYESLPEHWRYSSAANYAGLAVLMTIDRW